MRYQGESPDEITLVDTAHRMGYTFINNGMGGRFINMFGCNQNIFIRQLQYFGFNSDRKRASIIVEHNGLIKLMIKGADSFIIDRLSKDTPQPYLKEMEKELVRFSKKGLRTLCMAERVLSPSEYKEVKDKMRQAMNSNDQESAVA